MQRMIHPLRSFAAPLTMCLALAVIASSDVQAAGMKFARFQSGDTIAYGIVEGDRVRQIDGELFGDWKKTDKTFALSDVTLLVPTEPSQVIALAGNYHSHIATGEKTVTTIVTTTTTTTTDLQSGETTSNSTSTTETRSSDEVPEKFRMPQPFYKSPSCLTANETNIVIPKEADTVHFEAELVIVIGREASKVSEVDAMDYVFGVTCGNDVSARVWQRNDVQWWRAKGADTFGPCGPFIATGIDYDNLLTKLRLNGKVMQEESTSHMIHGVAKSVSFISQHVKLHPGDLIFTGTSGKTAAIKAGDVVEVDIEGIGVLRNHVVAE
ncbi:MAG: fumarylacetoacetate hydrolase family protein [Planctomycetaceae bacterium]|nr:fumarylacetoacetate hydrolase family protein [Planctomycetaceae bacterium]